MAFLNRTRVFVAMAVLVALVYFTILGRVVDTLGIPRPVAPHWRPGAASPKETAFVKHLGQPRPKTPRPRPAQDPAVGMPDRLDRLEDVLDVTFGAACAGWNPHGDEKDDPPDCLRAKQFREIQTFKKMGFNWEAFHAEEQKEAIKHLELCVLGYRVCPERPLIIADYWFAFTAKSGTSGECVWLEPVVDTAQALGFAYFPANMFKSPQNWNLTRIFTHSLHMYWPLDSHGYQCLTNPRCVRPEDYTPAADPKHRWDVSRIPKHEIGTLPAWRVFMPTYWGTRPDAIGYPGTSPALFWGQGKVDRWQEWSLHILGQKWQFTPYPYPGHTWLPLTVEQSCLSAPTKPWKDRPNHVLILAKSASYFHEYNAGEKLLPHWPKIIKALDEWGIKLVTTAKVEDPKKPVPEGMIKLGQQSKYDYELLLANSKALMGLGRPEISPSPYNALCAGVPVVMPYYDKHITGTGWERYNQNHHQHGPVNELPQPYSYPYNMSDINDLIENLRKAVNHPIESYIPEEMRLKNARDKATEFLFHDWEGEYRKVLATTGGRIAEYDPGMAEACMATNWCVDPGTQGEGPHGIMKVN